MEQFIKVTIPADSVEESEILMAELSEHGFYGFDDEPNPGNQDKTLLNAYIASANYSQEKIREILGDRKYFSVKIIEDKNWNEEWERGFQPVYVHSFAGVRASFHEPLKNVTHEIVITPKMSFGTGHHPTTYLMVEQMEKIDFPGKTVIDFGTGTGILAILAEKLGAGKVFAVDSDEWCVENATENIYNNNCTKIAVIKADSLASLEKSDIILANINLNILLENLEEISSVSHPGTLLLISGFLCKDERELLSSFDLFGFTESAIKERENWASILLQKR